MTEYINTTTLLKEIDYAFHTDIIGKKDVINLIINLTVADVAEVVRCRDCKRRGTDYCIFHIKGEPADEELLRKLDNDFCSYGERKGGAD